MTILINDIAAKSSGALTVLKDFYSYCSSNEDKNVNFIFFVSVDCFDNTEHIKVIKLPAMSWRQRIKWDNGGLKDYCESNEISPSLIISLQNTCTNYLSVPQLVYYHQSLALTPYKWNLFKNDERIMFLYAHFYKFFINKNNQNAHYVVQLPYIKSLFCKKFKNIEENRVSVIRPNNPIIQIDEIEQEKHKFRFVYPAASYSYKNHKCLIEAFKIIKDENESLLNDVEVVFTVSQEDKSGILDLIDKYRLNNTIRCIGCISYDDILRYYRNSDVLLFPSKIETYGLPLVEAAAFGIKILAADLSYAKEVLELYSNKVFLDVNSSEKWAIKINEVLKTPREELIGEPIVSDTENCWKKFLDVGYSLI